MAVGDLKACAVLFIKDVLVGMVDPVFEVLRINLSPLRSFPSDDVLMLVLFVTFNVHLLRNADVVGRETCALSLWYS